MILPNSGKKSIGIDYLVKKFVSDPLKKPVVLTRDNKEAAVLMSYRAYCELIEMAELVSTLFDNEEESDEKKSESEEDENITL